MNFSNIQQKLDLNKIPNYEEFGRLVRLVLENAIRFNSDPHNAVHSAARNLSGLFHMKFKDVEKEGTKLKQKEGRSKNKKKDSLSSSSVLLSGGSSHVISSSSKKSRSKESRKRVSAGITDNELSILPNSASNAHQMRKKSRQDTNLSSEGYVLKSEFDALKAQMQQMQQMMELFQKYLIKNGVSISQFPSTKSTPLSVPIISKV